MSWESREIRRYRAEMPPSAWKRGREPRARRRRRDALCELADGVARHLASDTVGGDRVVWTAWALRLGAGASPGPAPDGSSWSVITVIDWT
jgi:hypothetical protein